MNQDCSLDVYSAKNKDYVYSIARENGFEQIDKISVNFVRDKEKLVNAINSFDVCIFYLNENYSVKASMPTKVGEVLMCGVPIICNNFNEDIEEIINLGCGMVCNFDNDDMQKINQFLLQNKKSKEVQENCRLVASQEFSLNTGLKLYTSIYKDLTYE
jgi:glycosyltransferase involved in cell wall biosynthesis